MSDARDRRTGAVLVAIAVLLSACAAVGPDYGGPPKVAPEAIEAPGFARAGAAPVSAAAPPARWWESVGDPVLTRLVDDAFAASPTLEAAIARLHAALAQQAIGRAAFGPSGGTSARYLRGRIPTGSLAAGGGGGGAGSAIPDPIELDTSSVSANASWELDLFGGRRRTVEAASAAVQAREAALQDARVSLAADMAQAYARVREAQNRRALARVAIGLRERTLALTQQRRDRGTASQGEVERALADLAQAQAELPGLDQQLDQQLDQVALLAGREPGAYDALLAAAAEPTPPDTATASASSMTDAPSAARVAPPQPPLPPLPPETVPVGQPADWLRRRPDIREAERTLAARNATIGSRVAALFPSVSLLGAIATAGSHPSELFRTAPVWLLSPSLSWNFLDIPGNRARVRGAEADRDESLADYRRAVLAALQDANDSLARFGRARETLQRRDGVRQAASRAADIARRRYEGGTASLIDSLDAERQRAQADDQWVQARASLLIAWASLQKSLGLGWEDAGENDQTRDQTRDRTSDRPRDRPRDPARVAPG